MADNDLAFDKITSLVVNLKLGKIEFMDFIDKFEKICYNDISSRNLDYFSDGWSKATVSTFMKICLRAFDGDEDAIQRLNADLELNDLCLEVVRV